MLSKTVALSPEVTELALQLRRRGVADVLDATDLTRALYSSDASLYRVLPRAVAQPRTVEETSAVLDAARTVGMPVTTRGAGTSCATRPMSRSCWARSPPSTRKRAPSS